MSLTSYRAAPPRGEVIYRSRGPFLSRSGGDLLSHVLRRSTISASGLNFRVRDGIGCLPRAIATRPRKIRFLASLGGPLDHRSSFERLSMSFYTDLGVCMLRIGYVLFVADRIKPVGRLVPVN